MHNIFKLTKKTIRKYKLRKIYHARYKALLFQNKIEHAFEISFFCPFLFWTRYLNKMHINKFKNVLCTSHLSLAFSQFNLLNNILWRLLPFGGCCVCGIFCVVYNSPATKLMIACIQPLFGFTASVLYLHRTHSVQSHKKL